MMIEDLIENYEETIEAADNGDFDTVLTLLTTKSISVTDDTPRDTSWVSRVFTTVLDADTGATEADLILSTLQTSDIPRVKAAYGTMMANGLPLDDPQTQQLIHHLGKDWPGDLVDRLCEFGVRMVSPAEQILQGPITKDGIVQAWAQRGVRLRKEKIIKRLDSIGNVELRASIPAARTEAKELLDQVLTLLGD